MHQTQIDRRLLDRVAARRAQAIVNQAVNGAEPQEVDNLVTKALGVFQEDGVYAGFLFLFSRTRKKDQGIAAVVSGQLLALAAEDLPFGWRMPEPPDARTALEHVSDEICGELDRLLMTKELFEQTLIYARYGAKARKNDDRGD
jgi:hypothetical protein